MCGLCDYYGVSDDYHLGDGKNGRFTDWRNFWDGSPNAADTVPGDATTTFGATINGTITNELEDTTDVDWFFVTLNTGSSYTFTVEPSSGSALFDPNMAIFDSGSNMVFTQDDGIGPGTTFTFVPAVSGTYFIDVRLWGGGTPGEYDLTVTETVLPPDPIPGNLSTTETLAIGGSRSSTIDYGGDQDWFAVTLTGGETYQFNLDEDTAGPTSPIPDTILYLYDSSGTLITSNDDANGGLFSEITYTATTSGTFYVGAGGFSTDTGDYTVSAQMAPPPPPPPPIEDTIDWGTQVAPADGIIDVYFAGAGEVFDGQTSEGWNAYEIQQSMAALQTFADVANLTFQQTGSSASADFIFVTISGAPFLGYFNPPGTANEGVGVFVRDGTGWDEAGGGGLEQGGFGWITLIHEIGHGLGLAHPHDTGGTSVVMDGVTGPFGSYGLFSLNQGVWTTMSYNDGWQTGPLGVPLTNNYGYQATPMALDIERVQAKYGANTSHMTGNDIYYLPDTNGFGTYFESIWDAGGVDVISASLAASEGVVIDLRPATIDYSLTGGGAVSYSPSYYGGFTIAENVVIEEARGGDFDDTLSAAEGGSSLTGNGGDDLLLGRSGADFVDAGSGTDSLDGEGGDDTLLGGQGNDILLGRAGNDLLNGGNNTDSLDGGEGDDKVFGGNGEDSILGGVGNDTLVGGRSDSADTMFGGEGNDIVLGQEGEDELFGELGNDRLSGGSQADILVGGQGLDTLIGGGGKDTLFGGAGDDELTGSAQADLFVFFDGDGNDTITDFAAGVGAEKINLAGITAITDYADLIANHLFDVGGVSTLIDDLAGTTILLTGVTIGSLISADFDFTSVPVPEYAEPGFATGPSLEDEFAAAMSFTPGPAHNPAPERVSGGEFGRADAGMIDALESLPEVDLLAELMGGESLLPTQFEFDYL